MVSIIRPYYRPNLLPKALSGLSVPPSQASAEMSKTQRYSVLKRPTPQYVSKLSSEEEMDLQEFMENALLENVASLTVADPRERGFTPASMPNFSMIKYDHPSLHKKVYRPQWTWADIKKCFGSVSLAPLQEYWMVPEENVQPAVRSVSPRCAVKATGMSLNAALDLIGDVTPEPLRPLPYAKWYPSIMVQTNTGRQMNKMVGVVEEPRTKVTAGARRKPIHEYALRLPHVQSDGTVLTDKATQHSMLFNLMVMPSYGDDINPQYVSLAVEAAQWMISDLHEFVLYVRRQNTLPETREKGDKGEVREYADEEVLEMVTDVEGDPRKRLIDLLEPIAQWTWNERVPTYDADTSENPASCNNIAWTPQTRAMLSSAISMVLTGRWEQIIAEMPETDSLTQGLTWRLAVAIMRTMHRSRYRKHYKSMDAVTLLGVSKVTGVSPIVFLNYFRDHLSRTGVVLFTTMQADELADLIAAEDVLGSGAIQIMRTARRDHLVEDIRIWSSEMLREEDKVKGITDNLASEDITLYWEPLLLKMYERTRTTTPKHEDEL